MKIILAAHGHLAKELLNSAELICGKQTDVVTISFTPGNSLEELQNEYLKNIQDSQEILFIVDVFGGTPYNIASVIAAKQDNCDVLTGASLPMLLEVFMLKADEKITVAELVEKIIANKADYIKSCKKLLQEVKEEEL